MRPGTKRLPLVASLSSVLALVTFGSVSSQDPAAGIRTFITFPLVWSACSVSFRSGNVWCRGNAGDMAKILNGALSGITTFCRINNIMFD